MTPPRRTREESRADTRAALLASAEQQFLARGYLQASLDDIAEAAGYSKGAIYSNFDSKHELFLAVGQARGDRQSKPLLDALASGNDVESKLEAFGTWMRQTTTQDNEWALVETEFALIAVRSPDIAEDLRATYRASRQNVADVIAEQADALGIEPLVEPMLVADALIALQTGFALAAAIDPGSGRRDAMAVFRALIGVPSPQG